MIWQIKKVGDCLEKIPSIGSVLSSQNLNEGKFPIIDQGQDFITGYTNDESLVFSDCLPIIIFGDHTRALKFIDFPFAVGADGTKILKPKNEFDPIFFYYMLKSLDLGSRGYARHFKLLKEQEIPLPSLRIQKEIVAKLNEKMAKIKEARKLREKALTDTKKILSQTLHEIFEEGKQNNWEEKQIKYICEKVTNINPQTDFDDKFLYIDIASVHKGKGITPHEMITTGNIPSRARRPIQINDVLFALTRPYLKNIAFVEEDYKEAVASTGFSVMRAKKDVLDPKYLYYIVNSDEFMSRIIPLQKGATYPAVNESQVFMQKILVPVIKEQQKIVKRLDDLSTKIRQAVEIQKSQLEDLKKLEKSYLREAFNGELI